MNAPADWWKSFFGGLAVDFWQAAIPAQATAADAAFLWKHLLLRPGARLLDVPCGHGRLSVELAQRGCDVTGVDFSADALALARAAAAQRGLSIAWRQAEMRELPGRAEFDAAFCFGNSFGYLDDAGNEAFLAAVARAVVTGGRFALDYGQSAESIFPRLEPHMEAEMGGIRFVEETRYDIASARIENRFTLSRG